MIHQIKQMVRMYKYTVFCQIVNDDKNSIIINTLNKYNITSKVPLYVCGVNTGAYIYDTVVRLTQNINNTIIRKSCVNCYTHTQYQEYVFIQLS